MLQYDQYYDLSCLGYTIKRDIACLAIGWPKPVGGRVHAEYVNITNCSIQFLPALYSDSSIETESGLWACLFHKTISYDFFSLCKHLSPILTSYTYREES